MQLLEQLAYGQYEDITNESISLECASLNGYARCVYEMMEITSVMEGPTLEKIKNFFKTIFKKIKEILDKLIRLFTRRTSNSPSNDNKSSSINDEYKVNTYIGYVGVNPKDISNGFDNVIDKLKIYEKEMIDYISKVVDILAKNKNSSDKEIELLLSYIDKPRKCDMVIDFMFKTHPMKKEFRSRQEFESFFSCDGWFDIKTGLRNQPKIDQHNKTISNSISNIKKSIEPLERVFGTKITNQTDKIPADISAVPQLLIREVSELSSIMCKFNTKINENFTKIEQYIQQTKNKI